MTEPLRAAAGQIGAARDDTELRAAVGQLRQQGTDDGAGTARLLLELADRLEAAAAPDAMGLALSVAALVADAAGAAAERALASARRDALTAQYRLTQDAGDEAVAMLDAAAAALAAHGDVLRSAANRIGAARGLLGHGRHAEALRQAGLALDVLGSRPDALDTQPSWLQDLSATSRPIPHTAELLLFGLGRELLEVPARAETAVLLARVTRLLDHAGRQDLRAIAGIQLGCVLVAAGDAQRGHEILHDCLDVVQRISLSSEAEHLLLEERDRGRYWMARALQLSGRADEALAGYRAHPWWRTGDAAQRAELAARTVSLLLDEGRLPDALEVLDAAAPVAADAPVAAGSQVSAGSQGRLLRALRAKADALLNRAPAPGDGPGDGRGADARERLAWLEHDLLRSPGRDGLAEDLARVEAAVTDQAATELRPALARARGDLAWARGDARTALECYQAALDALLEPVLLDGWAEYWYGEALERWEPGLLAGQARASRVALGAGAGLCLRIARAQAALGDDPALAFEAALAAAGRRNQHATLFAARLARARWRAATGADEDARLADLEAAADVLEGLRARLRDEELQLGALLEQDAVYADLLGAVAVRGDGDAALRVLERAKARVLLDRLTTEPGAAPHFGQGEAGRGGADPGGSSLSGSSPGGSSPGGLGLDDLDEARAQRGRIVRALGRQLAEPGYQPAGELDDAKRRLAAVYRRRRPPPATPHAGATPEQVRELGTNGTFILNYFCEPDRILVMPVGGGDETLVSLPTTPAQVQALLEASAAERELRSTPHSLVELHARLLAPLEPVLSGASRLLIIPHGVLHAVPFHALRPRRGPYLIERLPVSYAPSAAVALRAGRRLSQSPAGQRSVALGLELLGYLPLGPLASVAGELDAVTDALPGTDRYDSRRADRQALLGLVGEVDVLHLACHGQFDPDDALLSRLYLADGPVYGYELLDLRVRPRLVVFSACETARHERLPGDEILGLVRPFLGLGAGAVLATLWEVPDASTAELMVRFYREYAAAPDDPAACLRAAQLALLGSGRHAHPHYWAPYTLTGGLRGG